MINVFQVANGLLTWIGLHASLQSGISPWRAEFLAEDGKHDVKLPQADRDAISRRFWEIGRLTLEHWLTPRLDCDRIHRWPATEVVHVAQRDGDGPLRVTLSGAQRREVDHVLFATGYRADLRRVPYLAGLSAEIKLADGYPLLDEAFATSLPGLYVTGFSATRDFGPFFGFVKGCPAAATLIVRDLLSRANGSRARPD